MEIVFWKWGKEELDFWRWNRLVGRVAKQETGVNSLLRRTPGQCTAIWLSCFQAPERVDEISSTRRKSVHLDFTNVQGLVFLQGLMFLYLLLFSWSQYHKAVGSQQLFVECKNGGLVRRSRYFSIASYVHIQELWPSGGPKEDYNVPEHYLTVWISFLLYLCSLPWWSQPVSEF